LGGFVQTHQSILDSIEYMSGRCPKGLCRLLYFPFYIDDLRDKIF